MFHINQSIDQWADWKQNFNGILSVHYYEISNNTDSACQLYKQYTIIAEIKKKRKVNSLNWFS